MTEPEFLTRYAAQVELDLGAHGMEKLIECGVVTDTQRVGRQILIPRQEVENLRATPWVRAPHPGFVHVKVAAWNGEYGWHPDLDPYDPKQIEGICGWWPVANAEVLKGELFIPTALGFILGVYEILDVETHRGDRRFELDPGEPTSESAAAFINLNPAGRRFRRMPSIRGNKSGWVPPKSA